MRLCVVVFFYIHFAFSIQLYIRSRKGGTCNVYYNMRWDRKQVEWIGWRFWCETRTLLINGRLRSVLVLVLVLGALLRWELAG